MDKQRSDCSNSRVLYGNSSHRKADLENLTKMCYAYGKQISRTGTSNVIFGYNGRDGVITDANRLIYMRARYYSPEMRRFINADIIPGEISNAITLNRFAYANGNPVSNVDPFGLSAERGSAGKDYLDMRKISPPKQTNYYQAVLVTRFDNEGLKIVGHTQLYFLGDDGVWYYTEFTTAGGDNIKEMKGNAQIYWGVRTPPVYDGTFKDVKGSNYVVLNGNFNNSVILAQQYYNNQEFGEYNFLFHNCSDYTDVILDVADVDGMFSQIMINGDSLISIPVIREFEASLWGAVDSGIDAVSNAFVSVGNYIGGDSNGLGQMLITTGEVIDKGADFVGDVTGTIVGGIVDTKKAIGNGIIDGVKKVWDWITFWD